MTSRNGCADEEELLLLLDGELTENDADRLRRHLRTCDVCAARSEALERTLRQLKVSTTEVDPAVLIDDVMRRLPAAVADAGAFAPPRRMMRWALVGAGFAAAVAMAAFLLAPQAAHHVIEDTEGFTARGAPVGESIARAVGVSVRRPAVSRDPLAPETPVRADDAYAVRYRNLLGHAVYLLAFAVDSAGTVHWLAPAYLEPTSNPAAVPLAPSDVEVALPPAMQLEAPSAGPLRFVAILSSSPLHVLDVDGLRSSELATESLRARWPGAVVRELVTVNVVATP